MYARVIFEYILKFRVAVRGLLRCRMSLPHASIQRKPRFLVDLHVHNDYIVEQSLQVYR